MGNIDRRLRRLEGRFGGTADGEERVLEMAALGWSVEDQAERVAESACFVARYGGPDREPPYHATERERYILGVLVERGGWPEWALGLFTPLAAKMQPEREEWLFSTREWAKAEAERVRALDEWRADHDPADALPPELVTNRYEREHGA